MRWMTLIVLAAACSASDDVPSPDATPLPRDAAATTMVDAAPGPSPTADAAIGPIAIAGPDRVVTVGSVVDLDAALTRASSAASYRWRVAFAPPGSVATIAEPTARRTSIHIDVAGHYQIELVVTDGGVTSAPQFLGVTAHDPRPAATLTAPTRVLSGTPVTLDAGGSRGEGLTYTWTVVGHSWGPNIEVALEGQGQPVARFTPTVPATYSVQLMVVDVHGQTAWSSHEIQVYNTAPVIRLETPVDVVTGRAVTLDASASTEVDGQPLHAEWRLVARPPGSAAAIQETGALTAELVPDRDGRYDLELAIDDGASPPLTVQKSMVATRVRFDLAYPVVAAAASPVSDRVILAGAAPHALHFVDPTTGADQVVPLPLAALSLAVSPAGHTAVVGHAGWISVVDVAARRITATLPVHAPVTDLTTGDDGWAYFVVHDNDGSQLYALRLATGAVTALEPPVQWFSIAYAAERLYLWDSYRPAVYRASGDTLTLLSSTEGCTPLWPSRDAARVLNACGDVLGPDLERIASLAGAERTTFAVAEGTNLWAIAQAEPHLTTLEIQVFDATSFAQRARIAAPILERRHSWDSSLYYLPTNPRWLLPLAGGARAAVVFDDDNNIQGQEKVYGVALVEP